MDETTERIVFEESVRDLTQQQNVLDGLRSRAGTLLAAASLVAAFLGGRALEANQVVERIDGAAVTRSEITTTGWLAVACFLAVLLIGLLLLAPLPIQWVFVHDAHALIDEMLDADESTSAPELYRHLAYWNGVNSLHNGRRLNWMFGLFGLSCGFLAAETVLFLVVIGTA